MRPTVRFARLRSTAMRCSSARRIDQVHRLPFDLVADFTGAPAFAFDHNVRSAQGKKCAQRLTGGQQIQGPAQVVNSLSGPHRRKLFRPALNTPPLVLLSTDDTRRSAADQTMGLCWHTRALNGQTGRCSGPIGALHLQLPYRVRRCGGRARCTRSPEYRSTLYGALRLNRHGPGFIRSPAR